MISPNLKFIWGIECLPLIYSLKVFAWTFFLHSSTRQNLKSTQQEQWSQTTIETSWWSARIFCVQANEQMEAAAPVTSKVIDQPLVQSDLHLKDCKE